MANDTYLYSDRALFAEIAKGNENAFGVLFYRYHTKIYYFVLDIVEIDVLAQEIVQDVFLKIWLNRSALKDIVTPGAYLFVIAKNRALDQLDKLVTERKFKQQFGEPVFLATAGSEEQLFYKESLALVAEAVKTLPEQQRRIFHLSKVEGLSREAIAAELNLSPHTVKNHLGAAVKSVQQYLRANGRVVVLVLFLTFF